MSKRILFVDDETHILQGLQRMLRPLRHDWEMRFAASGEDALRMLAEAPCDVVVSDMRMRQMNGVDLLEALRVRYPDIVRIALSGQADSAMTLAAVRPAHRYLSKPCDVDTLRITIERTLTLRSLLTSDAIASLVASVDILPSVPAVYVELEKELESADGSTAKVADIIARDPAMTSKILQVVNSAFFGFRRHVSSPFDAVRLLGFELVRTLVLSARVFGQLSDTSRLFQPVTERLWHHSLATATLAEVIARAEAADTKTLDTIMTAGLLHDVGKLVLALSPSLGYMELVQNAQETPLWQREQEAYGASHAEVGAYLLGLWGLPDPIVETVAFHHRPGELPSAGFTSVAAVHAANAIEHAHSRANESDSQPDLDYLESCQLTERFGAWQEACRKAVAQDE